MKSITKPFALLLSLTACVASQSLLEAISAYPELSNFTALMTDNPGLAGALLTSNASSLTGESTILVPDNSAFRKISALYNVSMSNLTVEQLEPYLEYHLLVGRIGSSNFSAPQGLTVPTYLTGPTYNNRSAGAALGSSGAEGDVHNGQVVFFQAKTDNTTTNGSRRFMLRQLQNPTVNAQGGLGHMIVCPHNPYSSHPSDTSANRITEPDRCRRHLGWRLLPNRRQVRPNPALKVPRPLTLSLDSSPSPSTAQTPSAAGK